MAKRVFVSDIHMSQGLSLNDPNGCYDWFDNMEAGLLLNFLDFIAKEGSIDELVLVGDVLDNWVYPMENRPPHFSEIALTSTSSKILAIIRVISAAKKVTYLLGNHDITITKNSILNFGNGTCQTIAFQDTYETADGIFAEHGHQFCMYNAYDPNNELPLGHYISRLQATVDAGNGKPPKRWQETLKGALTALITPSLDPYVDAPLNYFCGQLNLHDSSQIRNMVDIPVTLREIRDMYADLPERWIKSHGLIAPLDSALEETPYGLYHQAEHLAKEFGKKVVVFGHTHDPMIDYIWKEEKGMLPDEPDHVPVAVYANCGCWCQGEQKCTYVEDDYDQASGKHTVTLKSWPSKAPLNGTRSFII